MSRTIRQINATDAIELRQAVLRPHQTVEECVYPCDDDPLSFHLGAFLDDQLVTIASVLHQSELRYEQFGDANQYRLRGMATRPEFHGQGHGSAVLQECISRVWQNGGDVFWGNARTTAAGFYRKQGFQAIDEEFDIPGIGPHRVIYISRPKVD